MTTFSSVITEQDIPFLRRALRLAMNGRGHVEPNPMVACVLVKNDQILGEGWHAKFGGPHAEPTALADCKARGADPAGATAYVTLEPCCHLNKKTPPCAPRLIEAKIARVVIGCLDPNPDVNGKGVAMLRDAGIEVDVLPLPQRGTGYQPVLSSSQHKERAGSPCHDETDGSHFQQLIAPHIAKTQHVHDLYVTLKWAESSDGRVAGKNGVRTQITNPISSRLVHQLRSRSGAIVVGVNTVITDDPELTVRDVDSTYPPSRIVLDRDLRIPAHAKLIATDRARVGGALLVVCSPKTFRDSPRVADLQAMRVNVRGIDIALQSFDAFQASMFGIFIARDEINHNPHALFEPGPTLARAILPVADRLWVFRSPTKIGGGPSAPRAAEIPNHYIPTGTLNLARDTLTEYLNTKSPAFFAAVPSADFVLAAENVARATSP